MGGGSKLLTAGLLIGGGALLAAAIAAPRALRAARPAMRGLIRNGMLAYAKARSAAAAFGEDIEDLFAEVAAELAKEPEAEPRPRAANEGR